MKIKSLLRGSGINIKKIALRTWSQYSFEGRSGSASVPPAQDSRSADRRHSPKVLYGDILLFVPPRVASSDAALSFEGWHTQALYQY
jgi:hypothetical protein